ncbi:MAG: hypothetical protein E7266_04815 [Lachnospiraceae bacterium]|nr:hypothetical protein [Lachnospiraceae bacterium]
MDNNMNNNQYDDEALRSSKNTVRTFIKLAFIFGIVGIALAACGGGGLPFAVASIVFVTLANKRMQEYPQIVPDLESELGKLNTAKTLSIISFVVIALWVVCGCGLGFMIGFMGA